MSKSSMTARIRNQYDRPALIALIVLTASCTSDEPTEPSRPPPPAPVTVVSVVPAAGMTGVSTAATIRLQFSDSVDQGSVSASTVTLAGVSPVPGTLAVEGNVVTFTPAGPLTEFATQYLLTVTTGVRSRAGGVLADPFTSTFTTVFWDTAHYYRVTNQSVGSGKVLDTFSNNLECFFADSSSTPGQQWYFQQLTGTPYYIVKNRFQGNRRALEGGTPGQPCLLTGFPLSGSNFTGQAWRADRTGTGYRLSNQHQPMYSLDVRIIDGVQRPSLEISGGSSTQVWNFTRLERRSALEPPPEPVSFTQVKTASVLTGLQGNPTGAAYTCGLAVSGITYCWGANQSGQLGDGTTTTRLQPSPVAVPSGVSFTSLSPGGFHACGLTAAGAAYCWGLNDRGQLGDGSTTQRSTPDRVNPPAEGVFVTLASGGRHTCGLTPAGAAYCWGRNLEGQLGDGTLIDRFTPVPVVQTAGVTFVGLAAAARSTCAITGAGAAYCWGEDTQGQTGTGVAGNKTVPALVTAPSGTVFTALNGGNLHFCGPTSNGAVYCWGRNVEGQLGDGTTNNRLVPVLVSVPSGVTFASTSAGARHSCGISTAGAAYCWGQNSAGQLGDGSTTESLTPVPVGGGTTFISVTSSAFHTCAITTTRSAACWGANTFGQIGDGTTNQKLLPARVE